MKIPTGDMTRVALYTSLICIASLILKFGGDMVVPFSILPLMVMLTGAVLGGRLGSLSVALYVLLGLIGIPVFAKVPYGGLTYVLQPSFGFLLGFIPAAFCIGSLLEKLESGRLSEYLLAMVAGLAVMYLVGLPYLYGIIKFFLGKPFTFWEAVQMGLLPFIGLDLLKAVLAAVIARAVNRRLKGFR